MHFNYNKSNNCIIFQSNQAFSPRISIIKLIVMKITAEKFNSFQFCRQTIIYVNSYYVQDTTHYREKKNPKYLILQQMSNLQRNHHLIIPRFWSTNQQPNSLLFTRTTLTPTLPKRPFTFIQLRKVFDAQRGDLTP